MSVNPSARSSKETPPLSVCASPERRGQEDCVSGAQSNAQLDSSALIVY